MDNLDTLMDTIYNAIDRLDADDMVEFWKEYWKGREESKMEEKELWDELHETVKKLNQLLYIASTRFNLRVDLDTVVFKEVQCENVIYKINVSVAKPLRDMTWD